MEIKIREAERVRDSVCGQFQWEEKSPAKF